MAKPRVLRDNYDRELTTVESVTEYIGVLMDSARELRARVKRFSSGPHNYGPDYIARLRVQIRAVELQIKQAFAYKKSLALG